MTYCDKVRNKIAFMFVDSLFSWKLNGGDHESASEWIFSIGSACVSLTKIIFNKFAVI